MRVTMMSLAELCIYVQFDESIISKNHALRVI